MCGIRDGIPTELNPNDHYMAFSPKEKNIIRGICSVELLSLKNGTFRILKYLNNENMLGCYRLIFVVAPNKFFLF